MFARLEHYGEKVRTKTSEVHDPDWKDFLDKRQWGFLFRPDYSGLCISQVVMPGSKRPIEVDEVEDLSQLE